MDYLHGAKSMADALSYSPHEPRDERAEDCSPATATVHTRRPSQEIGRRSSGQAAEDFDNEAAILTAATSEKIDRLIDLALRGALPRARALKSWEPDKLNARHISVIMMRACGYRQNRIAELTGFEASTVSIVLKHPDSMTILAAILAESARQAVGISAVVKQHAPEMLDIVRDIARATDVKPETQLKAAFGWLSMYERIEEKASGDDAAPRVTLASPDADRLIAAIREAATIPTVSYVSLGEGGGSVSAPGPVEAPLGLSHSEPESLYLPNDAADSLPDADAAESDDPAYVARRTIELEAMLDGALGPLQANVVRTNSLPWTNQVNQAFPSPSAVGVQPEKQVSSSDVEEKSA